VRPSSPLLLAATLAFGLGCGGDAGVHLSYDRCIPGDACGLGTVCLVAPWSVAVPAPALCSLDCTLDLDCPGLGARCVRGTAPGANGTTANVARCLRGCLDDDDCRPGTHCRILPATPPAEASRLCVPDDGPRTCTTDADCAPFVGRCGGGLCLWST